MVREKLVCKEDFLMINSLLIDAKLEINGFGPSLTVCNAYHTTCK